jgi:hypothetical protein
MTYEVDGMDDCDVWKFVHVDDLWLFDKLILAKKLNHDCGPAGVLPTKEGKYIVRPCVNYRMMGRGAKIMHLNTKDDVIPDGHFWCEYFEGRHLSFDYHYGKQVLAVEGFRNSEDLTRFSYWKKTNDTYQLPKFLEEISLKYEWFNIEVIGDKIIEAHLRFNDDFYYHNGNIVIPVWKGEDIDNNMNFYLSPCEDRIGFYVLD